MELTTVKSSMIEAVGYDKDKQVMEIVFKDGEVYLFKNVPFSEYVGLMRAESKGRYMHTNIIGSYPDRKITKASKTSICKED